MNGHTLDGNCWCAPATEILKDGRKIVKHDTTTLRPCGGTARI